MRSGCTFARRSLWSAVAGLALICLTGCGKSQSQVHGKVLYEDTGEPVTELAGFEVMFTSEQLHTTARGTIKPDGSFQLGTQKENDGVPPGEYVVTLTQPFRQPERPYVGDPVVEREYEDPSTSDLRAEVKSGKNEFVFKLRRIDKNRK